MARAAGAGAVGRVRRGLRALSGALLLHWADGPVAIHTPQSTSAPQSDVSKTTCDVDEPVPFTE